MTTTIHATAGSRYRGILLVDYPRFVVSEKDVAEKLNGVGLQNVRVWLKREDLPPEWPADKRPADPDSGFYAFADGLWPGPTGDIPRPKEVVDFWEVPPATPPAPPAPPTADGSAVLKIGAGALAAGTLLAILAHAVRKLS